MKSYKLTEYTVPQTWYDAHFIGNGRMAPPLWAELRTIPYI